MMCDILWYFLLLLLLLFWLFYVKTVGDILRVIIFVISFVGYL